MATAADTFKWDTHKTALKAWLSITGDAEDVWLTAWLGLAAKDCDKFCKWKWTDADDVEHDHTPADPAAEVDITTGIYEWVRVFRIIWTGRAPGLKAAKAGPLSESLAGGAAGLIPAKVARAHVEDLWFDHVHNPLIAGAGYSK